MKGFETVEEKEFYQLMLKIQADIGELKSKIDLFTATSINSSKCSENMEKCSEKQYKKLEEIKNELKKNIDGTKTDLSKEIDEIKKNITPLQNFHYKIHGGMIVVYAVVTYAIKTWG